MNLPELARALAVELGWRPHDRQVPAILSALEAARREALDEAKWIAADAVRIANGAADHEEGARRQRQFTIDALIAAQTKTRQPLD
jgi:hypothetical protein